MPKASASHAEVFFLGFPSHELFWRSFIPERQNASSFVPGVMQNISPGWRELTAFGRTVTYPSKTILDFSQDLGSSICYIQNGMLEQLFWGFNGRSIYPILFLEGCLLNEKFFISTPMPNTINYKCLQETTLVLFERELFTDQFKSRYPQAMEDILSSQALKFNTQIFFNMITSCPGSLARIACYFATVHLINSGHTRNLLLPSVQRLCALLHIHKSSFMRGMGELKQRGLVSHYSSSGLIVEDIEGLKEIVFS